MEPRSDYAGLLTDSLSSPGGRQALEMLLHRVIPAAVLVDRAERVQAVFGEVSRFLRLPSNPHAQPGSSPILLSEAARPALRSALHAIWEQVMLGAAVQEVSVPVRRGRGLGTVWISAVSLRSESETAPESLLTFYEDRWQPPRSSPEQPIDAPLGGALAPFVRRAVIEAPWPVALIAENGEMMLVSRVWSELTGYQLEEINSIGKWIELAYGERKNEIRHRIEEVFKKGERLDEGQFEIRARDGQRLIWEISSAPLGQLPDGRRVLVTMAKDVTARCRVEAAMKELNARLEQRVEERTSQLRLLQDVTVIANESESLLPAMRAAVERICDELQFAVGHAMVQSERDSDIFSDSGIWYLRELPEQLEPPLSSETVRSGEGMLGDVVARRMPHWIADVTQEPRFVRPDLLAHLRTRGWLGVPVLAGRQVAAVLEFFSTRVVSPHQGQLEILANVGTQLGRIIERSRLQEQMINAVWREQRRLGQELHDGVGQELTGINMLAETHRRRLEQQGSALADQAAQMCRLLRQTQRGVRTLSKGLFPVEVFAHGLMASLQELTKSIRQQCQVECLFECPEEVHVEDNDTATQLFRIAQEAVNNAVKHAKATQLVVRLTKDASSITLAIQDDGVGIQEQAGQCGGVGIASMQYRAGLIGGRLWIESTPSGGCRVRCRLPMS